VIRRAAIEERVREWGLREDVVEKDYVIGWLLSGIGADPVLSTTWVFKGGTCLKKCYVETWRFSEDLDFTVRPGGPVSPEAVEPLLREVLRSVGDESGIDFGVEVPRLRSRPSGNASEVRVYYRGPRGAPGAASVKIDLTADEPVLVEPVRRRIAHPYDDELLAEAQILCYALAELFAEKVRAMGERGRPRDPYDIVNLFRRPELRAERVVIGDLFRRKCAAKGVPIPSLASISTSPSRSELESEWGNMLAHQLPALPPFEEFWAELEALFGWIEGIREVPTPAPLTVGVDENRAWSPPATVRLWGFGVPLEQIRYAAVNRLCVELGYGGRTRLVEPYALRRTREGHVLVRAIKVGTREHRAYRADRIQSVRVTGRAFAPVYAIEFRAAGPLDAPDKERKVPTRGSSRPRSLSYPGLRVTLRCGVCGKSFRRSSYDPSLRPHRMPVGLPCPGRWGYPAP
jgi:predicted nucleotidyltransferase component of viral defense system